MGERIDFLADRLRNPRRTAGHAIIRTGPDAGSVLSSPVPTFLNKRRLCRRLFAVDKLQFPSHLLAFAFCLTPVRPIAGRLYGAESLCAFPRKSFIPAKSSRQYNNRGASGVNITPSVDSFVYDVQQHIELVGRRPSRTSHTVENAPVSFGPEQRLGIAGISWHTFDAHHLALVIDTSVIPSGNTDQRRRPAELRFHSGVTSTASGSAPRSFCVTRG